MDLGQSADGKPASRAIMPPYLVLPDFLPADTADRLLDYALANEAAFAPTKTGGRERSGFNPKMRVSSGLRDLGPFAPIFKTGVRAILPDIVGRLGVSGVEAGQVELELVAHTDGAFYSRHIDTRTSETPHAVRLISAVYYAYARPRAFTGGELRLFAIGGDDAPFVDIPPAHNSLLAFPSWAPHEVRPVTCPSRRFADSRFAVNCWIYRKGSARPGETRSS